MLAFLALFEAGDRVAVALPGYPPYRHILRALGCEPVPIETTQAGRWAITPDMLLAAHRASPLKGVLIASPANPTGTMMTPAALRALIETAEAEDIRFVSDEIYHGLHYAFSPETAARLSDRALIINSFSKYFCMTGWRIGWMVVPEALVRAIDRLQGNLANSVPTLSQIAAEAAFDDRAEMEEVKRGSSKGSCRWTEPSTSMPISRASATTAWNSPSACWRRLTWRQRRASISIPCRAAGSCASVMRDRARIWSRR
jgi:aspartate/methionine/tyrosine aminotransferase